MSKKIVSIITITYNNYEQLRKTLVSVSGNEYIESIVINGGNCEKTATFLRTYQGISVTEPDEGISDAFNKGIARATTGYIIFLNSGDILLDSEYLVAAVSYLENSPVYSFAYSNLLLNDTSGGKIVLRSTGCNLGRGMPYLHPTMIVKREVFDKIGNFDKTVKVGMDFDWVVRLEQSGLKGKYFEKNIAVEMDGEGASVTDEFSGIRECYNSLKKYQSLSIINLYGLSVRIALYLMRKSLLVIGAGNLLGKLKRLKYKSVD